MIVAGAEFIYRYGSEVENTGGRSICCFIAFCRMLGLHSTKAVAQFTDRELSLNFIKSNVRKLPTK